MDTIAERVARGAALLDERRPGWAGEVNAEELEMASCYQCMMGQIFGEFCVGTDTLDLDMESDYYGFDVKVGTLAKRMAEYIALEAAWIAEIAARLEPAPADEPELEEALA